MLIKILLNCYIFYSILKDLLGVQFSILLLSCRIAVEIERCEFPSLPDLTYLRNRVQQNKLTNHYSSYLNQFVDVRWEIVSFCNNHRGIGSNNLDAWYKTNTKYQHSASVKKHVMVKENCFVFTCLLINHL